ncbi:MAG: hypothetical protein ACRC26_00280 [Bacteroidales bacterium]
MYNIYWISGAIVIGCAACGYWLYKELDKNQELRCPFEEKEKSEMVTLEDVKQTFDSWLINRNRHIPFIAKKSHFDGSKRGYKIPFKSSINAEESLVVGMFDKENEQIVNIRIIYAPALSKDIHALLKNEDLIVLE